MCDINLSAISLVPWKPMDSLYYFSGSADKPPGRGANEVVSDITVYKSLSLIPHWRRHLSNFHIYKFVYNGKTYMSVEHAYQGVKISVVDKEKGSYFSLESGHLIGNSGPEVARSNRKLVTLTKEHLSTFFSSNHVEEILFAKFSQCPHTRDSLLKTGSAELWHGAPRIKKERQFSLERVRRRLQ